MKNRLAIKYISAVSIIILLGLILLPAQASISSDISYNEKPKNETVAGNEEVSVLAKPLTSNYNTGLSQKDIYDLARIVHGEARGEPFIGQVAVAAVVLNRLDSNKFGNTVQEVIFEPGAFTAVSDGQFYMEPDQSAYKAVEAALKGWDPTGGAIYYWNPQTATSKWVWSRPIINQIGKHVFAI